jgi:hypothetical protein
MWRVCRVLYACGLVGYDSTITHFLIDKDTSVVGYLSDSLRDVEMFVDSLLHVVAPDLAAQGVYGELGV